MQVCLFCDGDASEPDHLSRCDGRQGRREAYDPHAHARTSDPDTSRVAAFAVDDATEVQRRVYALHRQHPEGLTDEQLIALYARDYAGARSLESKASPRKRRSDLTNAGVLVDSGERRMLTSGRRGVVWKVAS